MLHSNKPEVWESLHTYLEGKGHPCVKYINDGTRYIDVFLEHHILNIEVLPLANMLIDLLKREKCEGHTQAQVALFCFKDGDFNKVMDMQNYKKRLSGEELLNTEKLIGDLVWFMKPNAARFILG